MSAEISTKVKCLLYREIGQVLVTECDDLAFGNKARKLILASVTELAQLNASYFSANTRCEFDDARPLREEVCVR
jgi:hypothetical protein